MHHNFIKLFSLKKCPQIAMNAFDAFLKNKAVKTVPTAQNLGFITAKKILNQNYNYIIKSTLNGELETFKIAIEEEYKSLLTIIDPYLNEKKPTFSVSIRRCYQRRLFSFKRFIL